MLSSLPPVSFCDTDASRVESAVISTYEAIAGVTLHPGDPVRLFLESLAYLVAQQRFLIDDAAKMNLLAYARADYLDHLGALTNTNRLPAQPARTTLRFSLVGPLGFAVAIPQGTRATADAKTLFATTAPAEIPAGQTAVEAEAVCQTTGAAANGLLAGQVNRLVDPVAYVQGVVNVTPTLGGSDPESDDNYRERIRQAPEKFSVAGPDGAYRFWALSAHPEIIDVSVRMPEPGVVEVRPLMRGGTLPPPEILDLVEATLGDDARRPLTDNVQVLAPEPVGFELAATYWIDRAESAVTATRQAACEAAFAEYRAWQRAKLGRDLNPSKLTSLLMAAGAKRVNVASPAHQALESWQLAAESSAALVYGGLENG